MAAPRAEPAGVGPREKQGPCPGVRVRHAEWRAHTDTKENVGACEWRAHTDTVKLFECTSAKARVGKGYE